MHQTLFVSKFVLKNETLTHFMPLRDLTVYDQNGNTPEDAFAKLPNLEKLTMKGANVSYHYLGLSELRSLILHEMEGAVKWVVELECPLLEYLEIKGHRFKEGWHGGLECPRVKNVIVICDVFGLECCEDHSIS